MKIFAIFFVFFLSVSPALGGGQIKPVPRAEGAGDIKVYFHSFQFDPFGRITIENVDNEVCVFKFSQDSIEANRLRSFVYGADYENDADFGYLDVRIKMENVTFGNLYLDKFGNILSAGRWIVGQLSDEEFAELKNMLRQEAPNSILC